MYLHPHSDEWAGDYANEQASILAAYGRGIDLRHIGSTAIDRLYAKDCIDLLGVVDDLGAVQSKLTALAEIGYEHRGEYGIEGRAYFSKAQRKAHLHIFQSGDPNIDDHLRFVEIMTSNPGLVDELNALKISLHGRYPSDKNAYQRQKAAFYERIRQMRSSS